MFTFFHINTPEHDLYHVSPKDYSFPSRAEIAKAREWSQWHPNGSMGLWCSTFPKMCLAFGGHVYRICLKSDAVSLAITVHQLYTETGHLTNFDKMVEWLEQRVDVIYISDRNGDIGEVIIVNFDAIEDFKKVDGPHRDVCHKLVVLKHSHDSVSRYPPNVSKPD